MKQFIACVLMAAVSVAFIGCKKAEVKKDGKDPVKQEQKAPDKTDDAKKDKDK
jgi:hypothetical protein